MKKVAIIVGTRPEVIKVSQVVIELKQETEIQPILISTGQHSDLLETALHDFGLNPNVNLKVMVKNQTLASLSANILSAIDDVLIKENPDFVLVQGDTTTALIGALAAFYRKIPVGHIEAGLRTTSKLEPFPEEINRRILSQISDLHFAPTVSAGQALQKEGILQNTVFVTGNTGIDALHHTVLRLTNGTIQMPKNFKNLIESKEFILVTCHRRESFGLPLANICDAIKALAKFYTETNFIFPVHPNPNVTQVVNTKLGGVSNIHLMDPLPYSEFVFALIKSKFVISDSGGIQEEAPSLGKHVLVLRDVTERSEAIKDGFTTIVGTSTSQIISDAMELTQKVSEDPKRIPSTAFGDGHATQRIILEIKKYLNV